jgi:very-short-patch-repair endonuclease
MFSMASLEVHTLLSYGAPVTSFFSRTNQTFNVAASRARDQMWIVHSLNSHNDLKSDDLRRQLIEHAEDPARLMRALEEKEKRTQSSFEREVMKRLATARYRVTPHWRVGTFRIDLVVEGNGKRLIIECDGDHHYPLEKLPEDMDRQSVLERMGWIFTRIRCSEFLRNPARAMKSVFEKLQMLEIPQTGNSAGAEPVGPFSHDVIDRVMGRAEELRRNWSKANGAGARSSPRTSAAATF